MVAKVTSWPSLFTYFTALLFMLLVNILKAQIWPHVSTFIMEATQAARQSLELFQNGMSSCHKTCLVRLLLSSCDAADYQRDEHFAWVQSIVWITMKEHM